jgi:hypothetical protein
LNGYANYIWVKSLAKKHVTLFETPLCHSKNRRFFSPVSLETRKKMSANNNKSVAVTVYFAGTDNVYQTFSNMSEAAIHLFGDVQKRKAIRAAANKGTVILGKYTPPSGG